jgi:hypothetical protein
MVNSGRDLKKTPIGGPYSVKEIKKKTEDLIDERVFKPFRDEKKPDEKKPEAKPADKAAPAKDGDKKDEKPSEVK